MPLEHAELECGALYIGGGGSTQAPSPVPGGAVAIIDITECSDPTAYVAAALLGLFFLWVLRLPPLVLIAMTLVAALLTTLL